LITAKRFVKAAIGAVLAAALAGCGAQYIRDTAQTQLNAGQYEQALKTYDTGLASHPDSVVLRAGQVTAKSAVFAQLMTRATAARAAGNDAVAADALRRAVAIDPNDARATAMLLDLERDTRRKAVLASAKDLQAQGMYERATLVIEEALKDSPRDPDLVAFQRRQELAAREAQLSNGHLAETRPVSLDFRDANLRMVLDVLTRNSGINFILDKDVRPDVRTTVFLRQTRLEDALELLTATNQLAYKVLDSATVLVYPRTPDKLKEYQDLVVRAFYLSSADVKQTSQMLKSMLKVREPFIDEKLNMLMLRETPETIRLAERMIALQDVAEPEVLLDVQVLELQRSSLTELGIKFPDALTLTPIAPKDGFTLGNVGKLNRDSIGVTVPSLTINLHRDVDNANILANPKIRARNREKARVLIGDKLPVVTTMGSVTNGGFISESVQYVDVGLKLDVEPNIYLNDEVGIRIGLEVSSLVQAVKTAGGSLVYQIGNRSASTLLQLRDGETQLLAGLISKDERVSANRVPGIGDLPLVGRLFASQRDDVQRTEIVLAITPRIVRNIRRPDLNQTEFWSGTENAVRSRPLLLPAVAKQDAKPGEAPLTAAATATAPAAVAPNAPVITPVLAPASTPVPVVGPAESEAPVVLRLAAPGEVKAGDTFDVEVNVKAAAPVRGMPVQLQFSPQLLQVIDAEDAGFFRQGGAETSKTRTLEQGPGRASMAVLRNTAQGAQGEGTAMRFRFKALAVGTAEVAIASATPIGTEALPPPKLPDALKIIVK
jgi:general secretion pathway protein D